MYNKANNHPNTLKEWFRQYLEHKYINNIEVMKEDVINKNTIFNITLKGKKNIFNKKNIKNKYYVFINNIMSLNIVNQYLLNIKESKKENTYFIFPFTKKNEEYLINNPTFIEEHKIFLINPRSINEKIYPLHKQLIEIINQEKIKKYFNTIKSYIPRID